MKIGTWNVERLKHVTKVHEITRQISSQALDILVLTEYDERINVGGFLSEASTSLLNDHYSTYYRSTERRVKIYSKYPVVRYYDTYDRYTSCCVELETNRGNLIVYGTIIGIYGNRNSNFKADLISQIGDFKKLSRSKNICVTGDYNLSFCDSYYYTEWGRARLIECFEECNINICTQNIAETIDHISVSEFFLGDSNFVISEWNKDKKLSDHKGIALELA